MNKRWLVHFNKTDGCYDIEMADEGFSKVRFLHTANKIAAAPLLYDACVALVNSVAEKDKAEIESAICKCSTAVIFACLGEKNTQDI